MKVFALVSLVTSAALAAPVDFNSEVRPILSEHCYTCHGPDVAARKSSLRLDSETGRKRRSGRVIRRKASSYAASRRPTRGACLRHGQERRRFRNATSIC
jgi:hypothetical protein